jgi:hypothetical protein
MVLKTEVRVPPSRPRLPPLVSPLAPSRKTHLLTSHASFFSQVCRFSGLKIYPGHGTRLVRPVTPSCGVNTRAPSPLRYPPRTPCVARVNLTALLAVADVVLGRYNVLGLTLGPRWTARPSCSSAASASSCSSRASSPRSSRGPRSTARRTRRYTPDQSPRRPTHHAAVGARFPNASPAQTLSSRK